MFSFGFKVVCDPKHNCGMLKCGILYCRVNKVCRLKPSTSLYWVRAVLGIAIGTLTALYDYATGVLAQASFSINDFFTGVTFALLFFIISYYVLKIFYTDKFEKKSKILSTGIGTYFIVWIVTWVLVDSLIKASLGL